MEKPLCHKITSMSPLGGVVSFLPRLADMAKGLQPERIYALIDKVGDITIDTVETPDTGYWETGIWRKSIESKWIIVCQYHSEEEAKKGHKDWVEYMGKNPTCELTDLDLWNLNQLESEGEITNDTP